MAEIIKFDPGSYTASMTDVEAMAPWIKTVLGITELKPPFKVVEFGAGSGKFSACFKVRGCQVLATDANPDMLERVNLNFPELKIHTRVVALPDVPEDIRDYDLVFQEGLVEHFPPDEATEMIRAMATALKPGGWVAVYMPAGEHKMGEYPYTAPGMNEIFSKAGLKNIAVYYLHGLSMETHKQMYILGCVGQKP